MAGKTSKRHSAGPAISLSLAYQSSILHLMQITLSNYTNSHHTSNISLTNTLISSPSLSYQHTMMDVMMINTVYGLVCGIGIRMTANMMGHKRKLAGTIHSNEMEH